MKTETGKADGGRSSQASGYATRDARVSVRPIGGMFGLVHDRSGICMGMFDRRAQAEAWSRKYARLDDCALDRLIERGTSRVIETESEIKARMKREAQASAELDIPRYHVRKVVAWVVDTENKRTGERWAMANGLHETEADALADKAKLEARFVPRGRKPKGKSHNHMDVRQDCRISGAGAQKPTEGEVAP